MIKTFCPICKKVHDSTRHCLAEENDTLKARVAELEVKCARYEGALIEIAAGNPAPPDKIASEALHP